MPGFANNQTPEIKRVDLLLRTEKLDKTPSESKGKLWFKGIASTESTDIQGERVLMDGLDLSYFLKHGWFDDEHSKSAKGGLGKPTVAKIIDIDGKKALYVEGYLYATESNKELYELMIAAEEAGDKGAFGFSVHGPVMARKGKNNEIITKAWIKNCAITRNPVNTETYLQTMQKSLGDMVKALAGTGGMAVGYPTPSYSGGGSVAPLMGQELVTAKGGFYKSPRRKTMKNVFTKAEWEGYTDEVRKGLTDAFDKAGVELAFADDTDAVDNAEKSLPETTDEMVKALTDAKAVLESGGAVLALSAEQLGAIDEFGKNHADALTGIRDEMCKSINVLSNHNEMIKSLTEKVAAIEAGVTDSMNKILGAMRLPMMSKAIGDSTVASGNVVIAPKPGEGVADSDIVSFAEGKDMLNKAFGEATDPRKKTNLSMMYTAFVANNQSKLSKAALEKAIATA